MKAYVNDVLNNEEVVTLVKTNEYFKHQLGTRSYMNAQPLIVENMEGESQLLEMEKKLYSYLKNQDVELLISEPKYSTALVNYPDYKAICVELGLVEYDNCEERLCALSHELGHYLDVKFNHRGDAFRFNVVYNASEDNTNTMELVAWIYGFEVLKALGYKNTKFFVKQAVSCLSTYVGNVKKTGEMMKKSWDIVENYENECKKTLEMVVE